jgi:hypothetical protein
MRTNTYNSPKISPVAAKVRSRLTNLAKLCQIMLQNPTMSVVYAISAIVCLFGSHFYLALCCTALCVLANPVMVWKALNQYHAGLSRYNLSPVLVAGIALGLLAGFVLALAWVEPAHAQFFGNAEKFVNKVISGNAAVGAGAIGGGAPGGNAINAGVVSLVMNTLRLLFVMYMLFGIVQVFQAVRQGEEWKDLARTPFFVVLAGTLGDVLVGAITG